MLIGGWHARLSALPGNVRGGLWAMLNAVTFAVSIGAIKSVGGRIPVIEIVLFSVAGQLIAVSPRLLRATIASFTPRVVGLNMLRVFFLVGGMLTGFEAVVALPVAQATAFSFTKSLFMIVAAALILAEQVGWRRWACTGVGFLGILVMLRPEGEGVSWAVALAILSAIGAALGTLLTRVLAPSQTISSLILWQTALTLLLLTPWGIISWVTPTLAELGLLAIISASGAIGNMATILALRSGEASAIAPIEYVRLPLTAVIGFYMFAEVPTLWTWIGAAIVIASTLAALRFELNAAPR